VIDWGYGDVLPVMLDPGRFLAQGGPGERLPFLYEDGVHQAFLVAWRTRSAVMCGLLSLST